MSLALSALVFAALPSNAQTSERLNRLQGSRNLVVTVNGGNSYYYMVSTDNPRVMPLKNGQLTIGNDSYDMRNISMRMKTMTRFALDEDSTTFGGNYTIDHGLLAFRTTMNVGLWNTIIVPFSLTGYQVLDAFGDDTQLATIRGISDDSGEAIIEFQTIDLDTEDVVLQAGISYLLKPSREPDVASSSQTPIVYGSSRIKGPVYVIPNVSMAKGKTSPTTQFISSDDGQLKVGVLGTYKLLDGQAQITPGTKPLYAMNSAGHFYQLMSPTTIKAFRSWLRDASKVENVKFRFIVDGIAENLPEDIGITTGISDIENGELKNENGELNIKNEVYDMQGRRIRSTSGRMLPSEQKNSQFSIQNSQLRKGIYIINGKKVVIK